MFTFSGIEFVKSQNRACTPPFPSLVSRAEGSSQRRDVAPSLFRYSYARNAGFLISW